MAATGDWSHHAVEQLLAACQRALKRFEQTGDRETDSSSCAEIVRRAARADQSALTVLLSDISMPIIRKKCYPEVRNAQDQDDLAHIVLFRLLRRFRNQQRPFHVTSFPAYLSYLLLTIDNAKRDWGRQNPVPFPLATLEALPDASTEGEQEARLLIEQWRASYLSDLEYELLYRRHLLGQSVPEIRATLACRQVEMTDQEIYQALAGVMRRLRGYAERGGSAGLKR